MLESLLTEGDRRILRTAMVVRVAAAAIVAYARRNRSTCLIGTHGRTGVSHLVMAALPNG